MMIGYILFYVLKCVPSRLYIVFYSYKTDAAFALCWGFWFPFFTLTTEREIKGGTFVATGTSCLVGEKQAYKLQ